MSVQNLNQAPHASRFIHLRSIQHGLLGVLNKTQSVVATIFIRISKVFADVFAFICHPFTRSSHSIAATQDKTRLLSFFNDYFPNVCIIGDLQSPVLEESSQLLDKLGIAHTKKQQLNASEVPTEVWTQLDAELAPSVREALKEKVMAGGASLTPEEEGNLRRLQGAAACVLTHRRAILDTIHAYDAVVKELEQLNQAEGPCDPSKLQALENKKKQLSSIFVFEHNARFGRVNLNNSIETPKDMAEECKKAFEALPEDWEYFSLATYEKDPQRNLTSDKIPGTQTVSISDPLVHPGVGVCCKAYAFSHRSYEDLKELFSQVTEQKASRKFAQIDDELHLLSERQREQGRRYHIVTRVSWVYRVASPSFHADGRLHFALHDYYPLKPYHCCGGHYTTGHHQ